MNGSSDIRYESDRFIVRLDGCDYKIRDKKAGVVVGFIGEHLGLQCVIDKCKEMELAIEAIFTGGLSDAEASSHH